MLQVRYDAAERIRKAAREKEEAKRAKEIKERKIAECENILEHLTHLGVILVLPNSREKYAEALSDLISEAGLAIQQSEKVRSSYPQCSIIEVPNRQTQNNRRKKIVL